LTHFKLLERLKSIGVDENMITESIADVIRGETVKIVETLDKAGELRVSKTERVRKPEDLMRGLIAFDILSGGELGLASEHLLPRKARDPQDLLSRPRRLPDVIDTRIISDSRPLPENED
tara:strand:- start:4304 stop:4663 length:360 start_codon:yes stop_codon:yes gene_type:complete